MTASEQRLGFGLVGILLLGGAFLGFDYLKKWKQQVDVQSMTMETRRAEAEMLLAERDFWEQRSQWLEEKQPLFTKRSEADLSLLNLITETASKFNVTVSPPQPTEPSERVGLTSSNVIVEARGDLAAIMRWLHSIQEPAAFISIPALTLTPNEQDPSEVVLNMTIQKWFRLPAA